MLTMGIESSCDDTSVSILENGNKILSMVKRSQVDLHKDFGGVVPEIAARGHAEALFPLYHMALEQAGKTIEDIDVIGATAGPGLIGSLLVGFMLGKSLAFYHNKPFVAVHHLEAHFAANFLENENLQYPMIGLLVSGGHSCLFHLQKPGEYHMLGETRDDAVGELYDKVARKLGLPMPGGPQIDNIAIHHDDGVSFTPPMLHSDNYDFSFSGLKTACILAVEKQESVERIATGMQQAVIKVLLKKSMRAMQETGCKTMMIAGGVAANKGIRTTFEKECKKRKYRLLIPAFKLCTDNAAMVARATYDRYNAGFRSSLEVDAFSRMPLHTLSEANLWG